MTALSQDTNVQAIVHLVLLNNRSSANTIIAGLDDGRTCFEVIRLRFYAFSHESASVHCIP